MFFFMFFVSFLLYVVMDSTIPVTIEPKCLVNGPCWNFNLMKLECFKHAL